jgi:opacity protein-like surface antigen
MWIGLGLAQAQKYEVGGSYGGAFTSTASGNNVSDSPTNAGTWMAGGGLKFNKKFGALFNYGRTLNSQIYTNPPLMFRVQGTVTEYSGTFVVTPFSLKGKIEPFFDAGAGALKFYPKETTVEGGFFPIGAGTQTRPVFIYGLGLDYKLIYKVSLRAQYRGLFYSAPNYGVPQLTTSAHAHMAEPMVGLVFKF